MTPEDLTRRLVPLLLQIKGYESFATDNAFVPKEGDNLEKHIERFEDYRKATAPFTSYERMLLQIVREKIAEFNQKYLPPILFVDPTQKEDESVVARFDEAVIQNKTGNMTTKVAEKQHYRTWTEDYLYFEVKDNDIILRFDGAGHPLVYASLCQMIGASGDTFMWLRYLKKALVHAQYYPNRYWHSFYGLYGCAIAVWELYYHLDKCTDRFKEIGLEQRLFRLLYLLLTRAIIVGEADKSPQLMDLYANRATLCYDKQMLTQNLFFEIKQVITPDIQYISDTYLAYEAGARSHWGPLVLEHLHNSKKMYQYGSLSDVGNFDSGYTIVEDATWMELVARGKKRNLDIGNWLYEEYRQGKLDFTVDDLTKEFMVICEYRETHPPGKYNWYPLKK